MPNDDAVGKGGWGGENVSKSDDVILVRSLIVHSKTGEHILAAKLEICIGH